MEKIRLTNGNTYEINGGSTSWGCEMFFTNLADAVPVIEVFTEDNMETVEFLLESGDVCGTYENKYLNNVTIVPNKDGWTVGFSFGNVDMVAKRLAALEATQEIQDEAIVELAAMAAGE